MHTVGATVLIVDDDASARRLLQVRLCALGCMPLLAADGKEALDLLRRDVPAVMLLDLEMPRMGGLELLREVRLAGIDVPTIVITAHGSVRRRHPENGTGHLSRMGRTDRWDVTWSADQPGREENMVHIANPR
jgi:CheY-like chemotaxis protein